MILLLNKTDTMKLDNRLKEIGSQWNVTQLTTPLNIQDSYEDRMLTSWVPQYLDIDFEMLLDAYRDILLNIYTYEFDTSLQVFYVDKINEYIKYLEAFKERDAKAITAIHGDTEPEFLLRYNKQLEEICEKTLNYTSPTNLYGVEYASGYLQSILDQKNLPYTCEARDMIVKASVSHANHKVYVNKGGMYGRNELRRLAAHEIGTHITRSISGKERGSFLYEVGFANYIELEEGLAVFMEVAAGYPEGLARTYLRLVAANLCMENTFEDMYKEMRSRFPNIDENQIYDICFRMKRGLKNFNDFGGYTKDRLYLTGYLKLHDLVGRSKKKVEKILHDGKTNFKYYEK